MPDLSFSLYVDEYSTFRSYELHPMDYEMFPKVNEKLEIAFCELGVWSMYRIFPEQKNLPQANSFALG